jgi:Tol biopolymer transport system component/DNA-binding winged helix-turn-helix (wHTH) protein
MTYGRPVKPRALIFELHEAERANVSAHILVVEWRPPRPNVQASKMSARVLSFEGFRLNLSTSELYCDTGKVVRLAEQPFQILRMLLERQGEVLPREEIRKCLWRNDTVVEFEHSIGAAMNRLRQALGDSAENPRFIETLPRRGYRFMVPVESAEPQASVSALSASGGTSSNESLIGQPAREYDASAALAGRQPQPTPEHTTTTRGRNLWKPFAALGVLGVGAALAFGFAWYEWRSGHSHAELTERQLTWNPPEDWIVTSAISPDGKYLAYRDQTGLLVRSLDSGEIRPIFLPADFPSAQIAGVLWFPEGGKLLVTRFTPEGFSLWVVAVLGQAPPQLFRQDSYGPAISPDGKSIAFSSSVLLRLEADLWVSGINGESPHKLAVAEKGQFFSSPTWSPDGQWIAYSHLDFGKSGRDRLTIETQPALGGASKVLVSNADLGRPLTLKGSLYWSPDWRLIFQVADAPSSPEQRLYSLLQVQVNPAGLRPSQPPQQLTTFGDSFIENLSATNDGKRLAVLESRNHADVYLAELQAGKLKTPRRFTLDSHISDADLWTRDSQSILFVSNRNGKMELFKQGINDSIPQKLESSTTADIGGGNGLTPEGKWLLFWENPPQPSKGRPQLPVRLMRQQIGGGAVEQVLDMPYGEGMNASLRCPFRPGSPCVLEELGGGGKDKDDVNVLFYPLDPIYGKGDLLARIQITDLNGWPVAWAFSPDGSQIAVVDHSQKGRIEILNLPTRAWHAITLEPSWGDIQSISWDAEGKGFLLTTILPEAFHLAHMTLLGKVQPLFSSPHRQSIYGPLPSPDGRFLAFQAETFDSNVWLLESF